MSYHYQLKNNTLHLNQDALQQAMMKHGITNMFNYDAMYNMLDSEFPEFVFIIDNGELIVDDINRKLVSEMFKSEQIFEENAKFQAICKMLDSCTYMDGSSKLIDERGSTYLVSMG